MNSFSSLNELFGSITYYQILSSNNGYFFLFCKLSDNFTHVIFDKISLISPIILFRISYSYIQLSIFFYTYYNFNMWFSVLFVFQSLLIYYFKFFIRLEKNFFNKGPHLYYWTLPSISSMLSSLLLYLYPEKYFKTFSWVFFSFFIKFVTFF